MRLTTSSGVNIGGISLPWQCCGSGGMLMIAKDHITIGLRKNGGVLRPPTNPNAEIHLFGQE
jgi:hypothetical protein